MKKTTRLLLASTTPTVTTEPDLDVVAVALQNLGERKPYELRMRTDLAQALGESLISAVREALKGQQVNITITRVDRAVITREGRR